MLAPVAPIPGKLAHRARRVRATSAYYGHNRTRVARHYSFDLLRRLSPLAAVEGDGIRYLVGTGDLLGRHLYVFKNYEQDVMDLALSIVEDRVDRRPLLADRTFIDVGANLGTSIIPAIKRHGAGAGIAFEPAPENHRVLRCNLILNGVEDLVATHQVAVSDRDGEVLLELSGDNSGDHRVRDETVRPTSGVFGEDLRPTMSAKALRLDSLVEQGTVSPSQVGLVWVDVQGHEAQVLAGAGALIQGGAPFVIEVWPYGLRRAGGLSRLCQVVAERFTTIVDVRASQQEGRQVARPAGDLASLAAGYDGVTFTDVVLLP